MKIIYDGRRFYISVPTYIRETLLTFFVLIVLHYTIGVSWWAVFAPITLNIVLVIYHFVVGLMLLTRWYLAWHSLKSQDIDALVIDQTKES